MNNYWSKDGKYQEELINIYSLMPKIGYTNNKYFDLFILATKVYSDVYNNGGCNLKDIHLDKIKEHVKPFVNDLKSINFNVSDNTLIKYLKNKERLELFFDEVIEFVKDKDLQYTKYVVYQNYECSLLSNEWNNDFSEVSFGNKEDYDEWVNHRINSWDFKFV
jgi:hypothetical protein